MKPVHILLYALAGVAGFLSCSSAEEPVRPRVIVTCDPELDDNNSLIRYLLFSDGYDTEGLIYASSQFHWKGDGKGTTQYIPGREYARADRDLGPQTHWRWAEGERFIDSNVEAYEAVYPFLKVHGKGFPTPEYLKSVIREGNVSFEGDISEDTPGSDLIRKVLLDDDMRPVFLQVWGGPSTVSRALKSIQDEFEGTPEWPSVRDKVYAKARLCLSGVQDPSYDEYVRPNWPELVSVVHNSGVISLGYGAKRSVASVGDTLYYSAEWTAENILGKGPLSDRYRVWGDGQQMSPGDFTDYFGMDGYSSGELAAMGYWVWTPPQPKGNFISEGDTPQFLNIIGNGLRAWEDPRWGGWAGRLAYEDKYVRTDGFTVPTSRGPKETVLPDFAPDVQNNFAARMSWCTTDDFKAVNHEPVLKGALSMTAPAGKPFKLSVKVADPDSDEVSLCWAQYRIMDSYQGEVTISDPSSASTSITIPTDAKPGDQIHMVLTARDNGTPVMTSYHRVVITVR